MKLPGSRRSLKLPLAALLALGSSTWSARVDAFCGFYVTGADSTLYANATMVVLMRDGTRTVLSMQNNYQGPPESFALVIPVPVVLQKENVKVLTKDVFQRVDSLGAPRLVEYWEADPCQPQFSNDSVKSLATGALPAAASAGADSVRIEAQFTVGEYDVVVLSADDSSALDTWLRENKYNIPDGSAPVLAPYVASGMKFFVAKVDPARVTFNGNQAALSPLRFYYDTPEFSLPVRLGLLNSQGSQDLIVNILAPQRYEVANYPNVTVPTNIRVQNDVRNDFASFYEALYARVLEKHPKAVVTEYSWSSSSCDPCPTPPLTQQDLLTLGADVLQTASTSTSPTPRAGSAGPNVVPGQPPFSNNFTLTRLHARYTKDMLGEDLVFQQAGAIMGGRGVPDNKGMLDQSTMAGSGFNNFQGRYVILHPWEKAISCQTPQRGQWGGPSGMMGSPPMTQASRNGALSGVAPKAGDLPGLLAESVPSLAVAAKTPLNPLTPLVAPSAGQAASGSSAAGASAAPSGAKPPATPPAASGTQEVTSNNNLPAASPAPESKSGGCAVSSADSDPRFALASLLAALAWLVRRRSAARRAR